MQLQLDSSPAEKLSVDALAVICFEQGKKELEAESASGPESKDPAIADQSGWLAELRVAGEFSGKLYEMAMLHRPPGLAAKRLIVIGGGKPEKLSHVEVRRIAGALVRHLKGKGVHSITLLLDNASDELVAAAAEGALLGDWEADKYKSDPKKKDKRVDSFSLVLSGAGAAAQQALDRGRVIAESQNLTRDLVNEPANKLTPALLTDAAKKMASEAGLECEVLDQDAMAKLGMGSLLGVAQGSTNPPFLIVLKYRPSPTTGGDHLALVGKGVTFDTGGISIKRPTAWRR